MERGREPAERLAVVELQQFCFGQGNGSGVARTVRCVACPIQIDDVRLPLGHRTREKPTVRTALTVAPAPAAMT